MVLASIVNGILALSLRFLLFFFSMGTYENFPPLPEESRNGTCGAFDYLFTFSATDYSPCSQLQYLITSGNYWGWKSCNICPDDCVELFRGNETIYKFNMVPKNSFGRWFVPTVQRIADPYFQIKKRQTKGYDVTLYQMGEWVSPSTLLDIWDLRTISDKDTGDEFSVVSSLKTRGTGTIGRGNVLFVPFEITISPLPMRT